VKELLSPKQVARAIGVSESSLKRWCDQGLIQTVRTGGGHRKLPICDVIRFLRERDHAIVCPEILGLPTRSPQSEIGLQRGCGSLVDALLEGNESLARQIIFDLYLARHSISVICDQVLCRAFREIGHRWECQSADVYQERRGCELARRILFELRRAQPRPDPLWTACGGTLEGDEYTLPTTMVELVLRDAGWNATSLGASIPAASMIKAIHDTRPRLFWVCVSHIEDLDRFIREFKPLYEAAHSVGSALAVGGRALTEEVREQITFCCYCDTMQQLEAFAKSAQRLGSFPSN
jgi:methanogenic corrinoid protein MtbC1